RVSLFVWPILNFVGGVGLTSVSSAAVHRSSCRNQRRSHCLTIASSPNPSTDGQSVVISGRLSGPRHGHAVVLLWRRPPGQKHFHPTAATRTDHAGRYSMNVRLDGNRWWYVTAHGFRSRTVHQRVQALVGVTASEARAAPGDQVTFAGTVAPSHTGRTV